ncbi:MAG: hypothetical protein K0R75_282 [Paenibacillaceae bacterium]|nr:hypothetical protein [Paenibacillaceae bacterium]
MVKNMLRISAVCVLMLAVLLGLGQFGAKSAEATTSYLKVHMVNVSGAAFIVQLPNGKVMVVDAGVGADQSIFFNKLDSLGITKIDYLVGTHQHSDHIAIFNNILNNYQVGGVYFPNNTPCNSTDCSYMLSAAQKNGVTVHRINRGGEIFADTTVNGLSLTNHIYAPGNSDDYSSYYSPGTTQYTNSYSLIYRIKYGSEGIMFTGDAMPPAQANLIASYALDGNQVFTAPHHGYSGSVSDDFLNYVQSKSFDKVLIPNQKDYGTVMTFKSRLQTRSLPYWSNQYSGDTLVQTDGVSAWTASKAAEVH